jgi:hypothetical protein
MPAMDDGVCGLDCSVDGPVPLDNCQGVHNPDQYNCNAEAELARDALPMGDACDPVPCPGFATLPTEYERVAVRFIGGGYVGCIEETLRFELGPIDVRPIGSHGAPGSAKAGDEVPVTPNWTEYRYCVQNLGLGVDCSNPDNIYDPLIRRRADRADERVDDAWHRVWIDELDSPDLVANPIDEGIVYRTGELRSRTWNWLEDFTAWSDTFPAYFSVPSAPIDGRFWAHAQTTVGMTLAADNPHGTGIHPKRLAPDEPADMLANYLHSMSPYADYVRRSCWTTHEIFKIGPLARREIVTDPRDTCPNCGALAALAEGRIDDGQQVVVIPWAEGQWVGVLLSDGSIAPVEERVGAGLMASLSQDWTWLSAVETNPMLGRGASGPSAVALTADGTTVAERMYLAGHRALGTEDMVEVPAPVKLMSTTQATTPPPREGAVGVYARSAGEVYVMGGEDAGTGELMRDIWWRGVEGGGWHEVPLRSFQPGKVLAATRPYADGKLWILDEVRSGWMRFGRLTRVDPGTGEAEELGKWPRFGLFDQQWLVLDDEGNVVVAASSSMLRKHTLVRIRLDGPSRHVDRVYVGRGVLAMSPWVDASGYALPISQKAGKLPKVVRLETLSGRNGTWGDMGGCL